jgi:hypothetical protein
VNENRVTHLSESSGLTPIEYPDERQPISCTSTGMPVTYAMLLSGSKLPGRSAAGG